MRNRLQVFIECKTFIFLPIYSMLLSNIILIRPSLLISQNISLFVWSEVAKMSSINVNKNDIWHFLNRLYAKKIVLLNRHHQSQ